MRYPLDEILDKKSIIQLKIERIDDSETRERLLREIKDYEQAIKEYIEENICTVEEVLEWTKKLYEINGKIWDLEAAIRQGREGELGLEEVGRRAIKIRENNGVRIRIKSQIVDQIGRGYKDIKINHASV